MARPKRPLPSARPNLLTVYDGRICIGHLLRRGESGVEAFDRDDRSLGIFAEVNAAANAVIAAAHTRAGVAR